jgi:hypothetical protein
MKRRLVLTPEGSLNWLFDNDFLFNVWQHNHIILMDSNDFFKHRRVALKSELSLIKYFMLSVLFFIKRLELIDYQKIYTKDLIKNNKKKILFG